ncbi:MAG: NAD-dependent epimerase/dehydratase family protein [Desulfatibacillaceae bacterium]
MSGQKRRTVVVTGACGALARRTIDRLATRFDVVAVDFRKKPTVETCAHAYRVDLTKRELEDVFRRHEPSGVMHLGRMEEYEEPVNIARYNANVMGTQNMLDLCVQYGVTNVVVLSSFHVYGAHAANPALIDENAPLKASELTMKLVDTVELDNLVNIYLWRHESLNISLLRPCHIVGPGVRNSTGLLFSKKWAPVLMGFSPVIQLIHIEDMARALMLCCSKNVRGVYNVAPADYVALQEALVLSGCHRLFIPSVPPGLPAKISRVMNDPAFPPYLVNYFKYPVIIDGSLFAKTFGFKPEMTLRDILAYYRKEKEKK